MKFEFLSLIVCKFKGFEGLGFQVSRFMEWVQGLGFKGLGFYDLKFWTSRVSEVEVFGGEFRCSKV